MNTNLDSDDCRGQRSDCIYSSDKCNNGWGSDQRMGVTYPVIETCKSLCNTHTPQSALNTHEETAELIESRLFVQPEER